MTIQVGGPPPGARHVRSVLVLRGAPLHGCAFPGTRGKRDDRADNDGHPLPAIPARPIIWTHLAHRAAIAEVHAQRRLQRRVVVWQDPDGPGWRVAVHDGWGQVVEDWTPPGAGYTHEDAREVANAAVDDLRAQQAASPWQWVLAPIPQPSTRHRPIAA